MVRVAPLSARMSTGTCRSPRLHALTILAWLVLVTSLLATAAVQAARLPSANRECAICHIMWITDFKREDVSALVPYEPRPVTASGQEDVVSTKRMCFSCHDGFVLDSRFMWKEKTHGHPVGQKPSDRITIPVVEGKRLFPLNDDGRVYCGTCHSAHGVDWGQSESTIFMRAKSSEGKLCTICHEDHTEGTAEGDHPIFTEPESIPPRLLKAGAKFRSDGTLLCQSCHRPHGAADDKLMVIANDNSELCGTCHADRYAADRASANRIGTHPVNFVPKQTTLPAPLADKGAKLGISGKLVCQSCHKIHDAGSDKALLVTSNEGSSLCGTCHEAQRAVAGGKHDMSLVDANAQNVRKENVAQAGVCSACHVPHKGVGPKMWARPLGKSNDPVAALCLGCHSKNGLAARHRVGANSHPVGVSAARLGDTPDLPLFTADGQKTQNKRNAVVSCATCHDPHRWDPTNEQRKAKPGERGNQSNKFLRKANAGGSALCRTCHRGKDAVRGSKHDLALSAPQERNVRGQSPASSGVCGACHLVHNATGDFLWARKSSGKTDAVSAACTSCHNARGPAAQKGIGTHSHPVGVSIDSLPLRVRSGQWSKTASFAASPKSLTPLPLYDKRGRRAHNSGRVGCGSCHDPHRWTASNTAPARPTAGKTEGGPDNSFLRIADGGNSALCINCHIDKAAVTRSKHDVDDNAPGGVCADCHLPHNAKATMLWARGKGPGQGPIETLCTDCHQAGGLAADKLTGEHSHPVNLRLPKWMKNKRLPTYGKDGSRTAAGNIDCATCHDPHNWTPPGTRQQADNEGDARSSFLRVAAAPSGQLCVTCHRGHRAVRGTDHDLTTAAPQAVNRHGQKPTQSGLCGQCHTPHNAFESSMLWARFLDQEGHSDAERRCLGCHNPNDVANNKVPVKKGHPTTVSAWSTGLRKEMLGHPVPDMPVYSRSGKKRATGIITCPTCHEPHRWSAASSKPGAGNNTEGDVSTSFLRNTSSESMLCADCHGADALFRYKYFHGEATRTKHHLFR